MSPDPIRLLVHGASGRMGRAVLRLAAQDPRFAVAAAVSRSGGDLEGAPGVAAADMESAPEFDLARSSRSAAFGPVVSQPDRSVSATASISSSPIAGGWKPSCVSLVIRRGSVLRPRRGEHGRARRRGCRRRR
jgi:hypothetical protein